MPERDESRHLAVGAGSPSDPDPDPAEALDESSEPGGNGHVQAEEDPAEPGAGTAADVVQAVAEFLDDLVDDPTFAHDPAPPPP